MQNKVELIDYEEKYADIFIKEIKFMDTKKEYIN